MSNINTNVDLTNCEKEPIHIPGRIQSFGFMLVLKEPDLTIVQVSENVNYYLGIEPLNLINKKLNFLLEDSQTEFIKAFYHAENFKHINPLAVSFKSNKIKRYFNAVFHRSEDLLIIEFEPSSGEKDISYQTFYNFLNVTISKIQSASSLLDMCDSTAKQIKLLTGYDRVMIYKFHEDYHGEVVAEAKEPALEPFLGLHYPASDIPVQARELYLKNWVRIIHDVNHEPSNLLPAINPITGMPLDLSLSVLRGISPIHIEYLKNMGVRATLTISIVKDNKLWGLIACHHSKPKHIEYQLRLITEFIGKLFSYQIVFTYEKEEQQYLSDLREVEVDLLEQMDNSSNVIKGLTENKFTIMDIADCDGAYLKVNEQTQTIGKTPDKNVIDKIINEFKDKIQEGIYSTYSIIKEIPNLKEENLNSISGLLALQISKELNEYIILFKEEYKYHVSWAGNPEKPVTEDEDGIKLSPRKSFEKWSTEVENESERWSNSEIEVARTLREHIISIVIKNTSTIKNLNKQLSTSNVELEKRVQERTQEIFQMNKDLREKITLNEKLNRKLKQAKEIAEEMYRLKSNFLANISHEVRTPLNGIIGMSSLIKENAKDEEIKKYANSIEKSGSRLLRTMQNIIEMSKIESEKINIKIEKFNLNEVTQELLNKYSIHSENKNLKLTYNNFFENQNIKFDKDIYYSIIDNLIDNAIKFTHEGEVELSIKKVVEFDIDFLEITVRDTGIGIHTDNFEKVFIPFEQISKGTTRNYDGNGLGLSVVKKYVELFDGNIYLESEIGKGTKITIKFNYEKLL